MYSLLVEHKVTLGSLFNILLEYDRFDNSKINFCILIDAYPLYMCIISNDLTVLADILRSVLRPIWDNILLYSLYNLVKFVAKRRNER